MSNPSAIEVFKGQVEAVAIKRDLDLFLTYISPDCVFRDMAEPQPRRGHQAWREFLVDYLQTMEDMKVKYLNVFTDGVHLAAETELQGVYRGEGADPGGTHVTFQYCFIDEIRDGLVVSEKVYWDPQDLARQLPGKG
ncbi:nuclear transport factor 2 family protein [Paenarthrobacter sp. NEAU-H11]|uniref:nuclear transport factor 2 family protein n=1 Tax=Paenarthrobacter sp. NEAU-H11 TaxID=3423924 RepID=UPI003D342CB7